jgi:L-ribulose-5-phosphate 3-epimerase
MSDSLLNRREFAALASAAFFQPGSESYRLGCQTLPYRALPLSRALEGIRKAGYRYVMLNATHEGKPVFTPALSSAERASLKRQVSDEGLTPFMSFFGLSKGLTTPDGLKTALEELDLCAEFGIQTVVGTGPWYYTKFPTVPKRELDWQKECDVFYAALEQAVKHAESAGVTITLKPHTGITARAKDCMQVVTRIVSDRLKICWDAGNVSFYEGIYPDPDLPDLAPDVKAVCIKDHLGGRAVANFPVPGQGQIDHEQMFQILFGAGFDGSPIALERIDGTDNAAKMPAELIDERITAAHKYLVPVLDKYARTI